MISSNATNTTLQYCDDLEIASVNDFEIEVLRKIISSEEEYKRRIILWKWMKFTRKYIKTKQKKNQMD